MLIDSGKFLPLLVFCGLCAQGPPARAQQAAAPAVRQFTVAEAIDYALANYPAVHAALEQYNAAHAGVGLAKTSELPSLDGVWQGDRGSRESVLGVLLPQSPRACLRSWGEI